MALASPRDVARCGILSPRCRQASIGGETTVPRRSPCTHSGARQRQQATVHTMSWVGDSPRCKPQGCPRIIGLSRGTVGDIWRSLGGVPPVQAHLPYAPGGRWGTGARWHIESVTGAGQECMPWTIISEGYAGLIGSTAPRCPTGFSQAYPEDHQGDSLGSQMAPGSDTSLSKRKDERDWR